MDDEMRTQRRLMYAIRKEHEMLNGWRRRHPHAGPEERAELARYAAAAKACIAALNAELEQLRPPEQQAA